MPRVTFIQPDGESQDVEAELGGSLMSAASRVGVEGILAECGGAAMCATCHVYIDPDWLALVGAVTEIEDEMLEDTEEERRENSRLSCQITVTEDMDGMIVQIPG